MQYGSEFWNKVKKINIILSILIVCIHGINLPTYGIESGVVFWIENYIVNGLGKVAVPMFFVLSGLKAYSNLDVTTSLTQSSLGNSLNM